MANLYMGVNQKLGFGKYHKKTIGWLLRGGNDSYLCWAIGKGIICINDKVSDDDLVKLFKEAKQRLRDTWVDNQMYRGDEYDGWSEQDWQDDYDMADALGLSDWGDRD